MYRRVERRTAIAPCALWVALVCGPIAAAEKLKYEVSLFGVEVAEIEVLATRDDRIQLRGETSGALTLFFPATEAVDVEVDSGRPTRITRRFEHAGKKGEWHFRFDKKAIELRMKSGDKTRRKVFRTREAVYDPTTALRRLRQLAPAERVSLLLFGLDAIYRFDARRVSRAPLHYRGLFEVHRRFSRKRRRKPFPLWLRALGLGRGATKRRELHVWLTDDARRLPTRIRMSDPRGAIVLDLVEPAVEKARGAALQR